MGSPRTGECHPCSAYSHDVSQQLPNLEAGIAAHQAGRLEEAERIYAALLAARPDDATVIGLLGLVAHQSGRYFEAVDHLRRAVRLDPKNPVHHCNLGTALAKVHHHAEAIGEYRSSISLRPDFAEAHGNLANVLKEMGEIDLAIASVRRALSLKKHARFSSNLLYFLYFEPVHDPAMIASAHTAWRTTFADPLRASIRPHVNDPNPGRRLRVGFVLPLLADHPVTRFLLSYLDNADRGRFELYCYCDSIAQNPMSEQIRGAFASARLLTGMNDEQAADVIRADGIDILVELSMHTEDNRLLVFAEKPAPVQVTYLAYAGTTGLDTIDYRLSDPHLDPAGGDESVYSEKTVRLETYWCYRRPPEATEVGAAPVVSNGYVTFGSLNNYAKATVGALELWSRVLKAIPGSRLMLSCPEGSARQRAARLLAGNGVDPSRLVFVGPMSGTDYFARYNQIDIALDPFPYPGGTTSCDALWMGVPVVTLEGKTAVSRGGKSILSVIGLTELIADTPEKYVAITSGLASDVVRLSALRSTMRARMLSSPLMDGARFARRMEAAFEEMWREWCLTPG